MSIREIRATVTRQQQETDYYCGAACEAMSLDYYKISAAQATLYNKIREENSEPNDWYTDPDGFCGCFNKIQNNHAPNLSPDTSDTPSKVIDCIFFNLNQVSLPSATLVYSGAHWLIAVAIRFDDKPDGTRQVIGIYVTDPAQGEPGERYIPYDTFITIYLKPTIYGVKWKDKFVTVSTVSRNNINIMALSGGIPEVIGNGSDPTIQSTNLMADQEFEGVQPLKGDGDPTIQATNLMVTQGFYEVQPLKGGGASAPKLVYALDGTENYTIVLLDATSTKEFKGMIYVAILEGTNTLLEVTKDVSHVFFMDDSQALKILNSLYPGETVKIEPGYVWKPCPEMRSRFRVARAAKVGDRELFVLPNGKVVNSIDENTKGGG